MSIRRIEPGPRMSKAVVHGDTVYLAGQVGAPGASVSDQTKVVLAEVERLLKEVGSDKTKILQAIIWLADMKDFAEMNAVSGDRVAVLVNSFGATPLMELYILFRRVEQRLAAKNIHIEANWIGHYCTSLDMAGASISILHLDAELNDLLHHPCDTAFLRVG